MKGQIHKKALKIVIVSLLMLCSLFISVAVLGALPKIDENEFSVVSFNGTKNFLTDVKNPEPLEDSVFWVVDNKTAFNVKYVSYLGQIAGGPNFHYYNYSKKVDELNTANASDTDMIKQAHPLSGELLF